MVKSAFLLFSLTWSLASGQSGIVFVPREDCTWRGGDYGEYTQCQSDEVPVGSCGSGKDPDCRNVDVGSDGEDQYDMLYCCRLTGFGFNNCVRHYADYGVDLSCPEIESDGDSDVLQTKVVEGICGSGRDDDCAGQDGENYSHMIECCDGFYIDGTMLYSAGSCYWKYRDYGVITYCDHSDEAVFGRCGSGRDADCNDGTFYMGIQCCKLLRL